MRPSALVLSTGSELSSGRSIDTNAPRIVAALADIGWQIAGLTTLPDDKQILLTEIRHLIQRTDVQLLVMTGGLGPTQDDHTVDVLSLLAEMPSITEEKALRKVEILAKRMQRNFDNDALRRQVRVVDGSRVLKNQHGLAPGMLLELPNFGANKRIAAMPGVPQEMEVMLNKQLIPALKKIYTFDAPYRVSMHIYTIGESTFQSQVFGGTKSNGKPLEEQSEIGPLIPAAELPTDFVWGITAGSGQLKIFMESRQKNVLEDFAMRIRQRYAGQCLSQEAGEMIHSFCQEQGFKIATAESCSGGMIGTLITDRAGSSAYYQGGVVAYSDSLKRELLKVPAHIIAEHGAVSSECAERMAQGALLNSDVNYSVSVTGIAGPDGATKTKPVGTVYIGLASKNGATEHRRLFLPLDRGRVREYSAHLALYHLFQFMQSQSQQVSTDLDD